MKLLLDRGAGPVEADAEIWASPRAWAQKMGYADVLAALNRHGARGAAKQIVHECHYT